MIDSRVRTLAALAPLAAPALAQVTVTPPHFQVTQLATGISASGESMAVDLHGNVYITSSGPGFGGLSSITRVAPDGTVTPEHATGFDVLGQLATNPLDGLVYVASHSGTLPVLLSSVSRIEPAGGSTGILGVDVIVDGFSIADDGTLWLGGSGLSGQGLYTLPGLGGGGLQTAVFEDPGAASNERLQTLASGDVLIAHGELVERHVPGTAGTLPYFDATPGPLISPNEFHVVVGLARAPFNALGLGAMVAEHTLVTTCLCGSGSAHVSDPVGGQVGAFASQPYNLVPVAGGSAGLVSIATDTRQDLYWLFQEAGGTSPSRTLTRISQLPASGEPGALLANAAPGVVSFDLFGPPAGGDPFVLGAALSPSTGLAVWAGPWGLVDLFPFAGGYVPLLDGVGLFGPPSPFVVTQPGGQATAGFPLPPGLTGFAFDTQALVLSGAAPNGAFYVSNVATFTVH